MKSFVFARLAAAALLLPGAATLTAGATALAGCSKEKSTSGCTKDTDCKGRRICEKGSCVDPTAPPQAAQGGPAAGKRPRPGAPGAPGASGTPGSGAPGTTPPAPPSGPGHGLTPPGAPSGPGAQAPGTPAPGQLPKMKLCIGKRCMSVGPGFGQNPGDMAKLFGLVQRLFMQGLSGAGQGGPQEKIKICIGKQCVTLDENLKKDPSALLRLLGQLAPGLIQRMFQGNLGRGLFGTPRRPTPGPHGRPPTAPAPRGMSGPATPRPRTRVLTDYASIARAGAHAVGREAELSGLVITSVATDRLVLEGPGKEMIVLKIPASKRGLVPQLRTRTGAVTVRFRILSAPVGKICHGALIEVK